MTRKTDGKPAEGKAAPLSRQDFRGDPRDRDEAGTEVAVGFAPRSKGPYLWFDPAVAAASGKKGPLVVTFRWDRDWLRENEYQLKLMPYDMHFELEPVPLVVDMLKVGTYENNALGFDDRVVLAKREVLANLNGLAYLVVWEDWAASNHMSLVARIAEALQVPELVGPSMWTEERIRQKVAERMNTARAPAPEGHVVTVTVPAPGLPGTE